jgi:folate-binding protein YgfZ
VTSTDVIKATRGSAGLFDMSSRGRIEVRGEDRVRWLDGMISGDVEALMQAPEGAGCYAVLLTHRGAIVADMHVARLGEVFTLESLGSEIPRIQTALDKFIIADDVDLVDLTGSEVVLGLEGPRASAILKKAIGGEVPQANDWRSVSIAGKAVLIGAFGFSGEEGYQLRIEGEGRAEVEAALDEASEGGAVLRGDAESLDVMRIEAGIPALGRELDEEVLPPEARLEHAISTTKGCYVGQEIVARLRSRGKVNHLLVGLRLEELGSSASLPEVGTALSATGKTTGEITSVANSPSCGAIALGYVRREHTEPGTWVEFEGGRASVVSLPFVERNAEAS